MARGPSSVGGLSETAVFCRVIRLHTRRIFRVQTRAEKCTHRAVAEVGLVLPRTVLFTWPQKFSSRGFFPRAPSCLRLDLASEQDGHVDMQVAEMVAKEK